MKRTRRGRLLLIMVGGSAVLLTACGQPDQNAYNEAFNPQPTLYDLPPVESSTMTPTSDATEYGTKAAELLTAEQLSSATGTPFGAPQPNGGKAHYTPTIHVSNATATSTSGEYRLDYSVYLGTADAVSAFWKAETATSTDPPIPGPWLGAFFWSSIQTFYGYSPGGAYQLKLTDTKATTFPDETALAAESAELAEVAKELNAALNP